MKHTHISVIPVSHQRYPTAGDYWINESNSLVVRISNLGNEDYEFLVTIHELIEEYLTRKKGISDKVITDFDVNFENNRKPGSFDEPGDSPDAPYYMEHLFATSIERMLASKLGVDWNRYESAINGLFEEPSTDTTTSSTETAEIQRRFAFEETV